MKFPYNLLLALLLAVAPVSIGTVRAIETTLSQPETKEVAEVPLTENSKNEKMVSEDDDSTDVEAALDTANTNSSSVNTNLSSDDDSTSNASGLPDTISRYEWERQGGWKKLVEAAYLTAIKRGVTQMCGDGMCKTVLYYKITGVATDPCYATLEVSLEVEGKTQMQVVGADLIAAPGAACDGVRSQVITVPPLATLTQYLLAADAKYGLYNTIKGQSRPTTSVPARMTRSEFTAKGGWERVAQNTLASAKAYLTTTNENMTGRASYSSELCFGEVVISLETLKVIEVRWDDARTPTCDYVRNDHPPLPSIDYLNQYLASQ